MNYIQALDSMFVEQSPQLMREIQSKLDGPYIDCVVKAEWPKETTIQRVEFESVSVPSAEEIHCEERTYRLQHAALNFPTICLEDIRFVWAFEEVVKNMERICVENIRWVWKNTFRRAIISAITTRRVSRKKPLHPVLSDLLPRKVNFFGREVSPYFACAGAGKWQIDPKYKRAATQYVEWHPDIVHFLFPDLEKWAGELQYRNIPDTETNPDGNLAYFRAVMTYAAKPVCPDLGSITTVPPPGFLGTLWFWAWKLMRFVP